MNDIIQVRVTGQHKAQLQAQAIDRGVTLSAHVRDLLNGNRPADLLSFASGGKFAPSYCGYMIAVAGEVMDSVAWDTSATADWLGDVDNLLGWLRANPYHGEAESRVAVLFATTPDQMRKAAAQAAA